MENVIHDVNELHRKILYPVCRIRAKGGGGSGVLVYSGADPHSPGKHINIVLTCEHVISDNISLREEFDPVLKRDVKKDLYEEVNVEMFDYSDSEVISANSTRGDIIAYDKGHDLAAIKLQNFRKFDYVASILPKDQVASMRIFDPVWVSGCSLSHDPFPSPGNLTYLREIIDQKAYLMANAPCLAGDTKIKLLDGSVCTIRELSQRTEDYWVYGLNEKGDIVPAKAFPAKVTGRNVEVYRVFLDNGEAILATGEHRFMMRDGSYKAAKELIQGESLMPFYFKNSQEGLSGYELVYQPSDNKWHYTHQLISGKVPKGCVRHHRDSNPSNNSPDNLEIITKEDHLRLHHKSPEYIEAIRQTVKHLYKDPLYVAKLREARDDKRLGKTYEEIYGAEKAHAIRERQKEHSSMKKWKGIPLHERVGVETADRIVKAFVNSHVGRDVWNKGYKKDKFPQLGNSGRKPGFEGACVFKGKTYEEYWGVEKALEIKRKRLKTRREKRESVLNHKIASIEKAGMLDEVYDIETSTHNFGLAAGIFVHNSVFGNSGGALFGGDGFLLGLTSRVRTLQLGFSVDVVTWMQFSTHPERLYEFFVNNELQFLTDSSDDYYKAMERRDKRRRNAMKDLFWESGKKPIVGHEEEEDQIL